MGSTETVESQGITPRSTRDEYHSKVFPVESCRRRPIIPSSPTLLCFKRWLLAVRVSIPTPASLNLIYWAYDSGAYRIQVTIPPGALIGQQPPYYTPHQAAQGYPGHPVPQTQPVMYPPGMPPYYPIVQQPYPGEIDPRLAVRRSLMLHLWDICNNCCFRVTCIRVVCKEKFGIRIAQLWPSSILVELMADQSK